jgi:hypothetical protein
LRGLELPAVDVEGRRGPRGVPTCTLLLLLLLLNTLLSSLGGALKQISRPRPDALFGLLQDKRGRGRVGFPRTLARGLRWHDMDSAARIRGRGGGNGGIRCPPLSAPLASDLGESSFLPMK